MRIFKHSMVLLLACGALAAGQPRLEFEVASVKPNPSGSNAAYANIPLGPGSVFPSVGGLFSATNITLSTYIEFAFKMVGNQDQLLRTQLPGWVMNGRFDIQARASGTPTKDQMREMMQSLLANRFGLTIHRETREIPVFGLVLIKPGKARLQQHPADSSCAPVPDDQMMGEFPALCGGLLPMPHGPGRIVKFGARNVTMEFIANQLAAMGQLDRAVIDKTGMTGSFDFALEWSPGSDTPVDAPGPTFLEALTEQLGLKLVSRKGPADFYVLDHIEHLIAN